MEKYFTPSIEDTHVGYECELLKSDLKEPKPKNIWVKSTLDKYDFINLSESTTRVAYLTKEVIEEEGWLLTETDSQGLFIFKNKQYTLHYAKFIQDTNHLDLVLHTIRIYDEERKYVLYTGECKDINSFRTIMKLLKI